MGLFYKFPLPLRMITVLVVCERNFIVIIDYGSCTYNPKYIKSPNYSVDKNFDPPRAYVDVSLQRDTMNIFCAIQLTIQHWKFVRNLVNIQNGNVCDFIDGKSAVSRIINIRNIFEKFGELPKHCPVKKEFRFLFKDTTFDSEMFPPFTPDGNYSLKVKFFTLEKDFVYNYEYRGVIRRK